MRSGFHRALTDVKSAGGSRGFRHRCGAADRCYDLPVPVRTVVTFRNSLFFRRHDWRRALAAARRRTRRHGAGLDQAAIEAVDRDLEAHIAVWAASPEGRTEVRTELMDSVDRQLLHRAMMGLPVETREAVQRRVPELSQGEAELERYIAAGALRVAVLRRWAGFYYGDRAPGDWFETYRHAADMRLESVRRDLERLAGAPVHAAQHHRDAAIRGLNTALRLRLLQAPAGVAIGRRGLLGRLRGLYGGSYHDRLRDSHPLDD